MLEAFHAAQAEAWRQLPRRAEIIKRTGSVYEEYAKRYNLLPAGALTNPSDISFLFSANPESPIYHPGLASRKLDGMFAHDNGARETLGRDFGFAYRVEGNFGEGDKGFAKVVLHEGFHYLSYLSIGHSRAQADCSPDGESNDIPGKVTIDFDANYFEEGLADYLADGALHYWEARQFYRLGGYRFVRRPEMIFSLLFDRIAKLPEYATFSEKNSYQKALEGFVVEGYFRGNGVKLRSDLLGVVGEENEEQLLQLMSGLTASYITSQDNEEAVHALYRLITKDQRPDPQVKQPMFGLPPTVVRKAVVYPGFVSFSRP